MTTKERPAAPAEGIRMIPLSLLNPSPLNPRKSLDEAKVLELAQSIAEKGILQNLVARPTAAGRYEIAAGHRRYTAGMRLVEAGTWPADHPVAVAVRELSDLELATIATTENVQRADMHPLDEAHAFRALVDMGLEAESLALKVGKSLDTVRKRLALADRLIPEVKEAFVEGRLSLGGAQAFTIGSPDAQARVLKDLLRNPGHWSTHNLRHHLTARHLQVKHAHFKPALYTGEVTRDLFGDVEPFFADAEQAQRLQLEAAELTRAKLAKKWAWAEIVRDPVHAYPSGWYAHGIGNLVASKDKTVAGAIVAVDPNTQEVKVHEGWLKQTSRSGAASSSGGPAEPRPKPAHTPGKALKLSRLELEQHLARALGTSRYVQLTDAAAEVIGRVPNRYVDMPTRNTAQERVELLAAQLERTFARLELIGRLEGDGIAREQETVSVPDPRQGSDSIRVDMLVRPGELWVDLVGWGATSKALPDSPVHGPEIELTADMILESRDKGCWVEARRALEAGLRECVDEAGLWARRNLDGPGESKSEHATAGSSTDPDEEAAQ